MTPEERAREIARRYSYRIAPDVDVDDFIIDFLTAIREAVAEKEAEVARLVEAAETKRLDIDQKLEALKEAIEGLGGMCRKVRDHAYDEGSNSTLADVVHAVSELAGIEAEDGDTAFALVEKAMAKARAEALEEAAGVAQLIKAAAYKDANEDAHDCAALIEDRIRALKDTKAGK
jgi:F0F1-type ATP synthase membrane subunit b/b'